MERPVLPSTKTPWFRYPEDLDPVLRDIRDNLDVLDSDVDDIQSGTLPIALPGIEGALGAYEPLQNMRAARAYVRDYAGADPTGGSDSTTAWDNAVSDLPDEGGILDITGGDWIVGDLVVTKPITIEGGVAAGQNSYVGARGSRVIVPPGSIGITFGTASVTRFAGPTMRNFVVSGQAGSLGGVRFLRANNWYMERVIATGFRDGFGTMSDGTGNVSQYGTLLECAAHDCQIGYHGIASNGIDIIGGYFDGNSNGSGTPPASPPGSGSVGILQESGDTLRVFGARVQFYDTGVSLAGASNHELHGIRCEASDISVSINAANCAVFGGSISHHISGSGGTGIAIGADATDTLIIVPRILSVATPISDSGTRTVLLHDRRLQFPAGGEVKIGATIISESPSGAVSVNNNLYVKSHIVLDQDNDGDKIFWGAGQDTNLYRPAANTLKTDDKLIASAGIGVGNSVAASTPGAVTHKIEVFDASGASIGFVPVYGSIT